MKELFQQLIDIDKLAVIVNNITGIKDDYFVQRFIERYQARLSEAKFHNHCVEVNWFRMIYMTTDMLGHMPADMSELMKGMFLLVHHNFEQHPVDIKWVWGAEQEEDDYKGNYWHLSGPDESLNATAETVYKLSRHNFLYQLEEGFDWSDLSDNLHVFVAELGMV